MWYVRADENHNIVETAMATECRSPINRPAKVPEHLMSPGARRRIPQPKADSGGPEPKETAGDKRSDAISGQVEAHMARLAALRGPR
jgi:hypothetical protein